MHSCPGNVSWLKEGTSSAVIQAALYGESWNPIVINPILCLFYWVKPHNINLIFAHVKQKLWGSCGWMFFHIHHMKGSGVERSLVFKTAELSSTFICYPLSAFFPGRNAVVIYHDSRERGEGSGLGGFWWNCCKVCTRKRREGLAVAQGCQPSTMGNLWEHWREEHWLFESHVLFWKAKWLHDTLRILKFTLGISDIAPLNTKLGWLSTEILVSTVNKFYVWSLGMFKW